MALVSTMLFSSLGLGEAMERIAECGFRWVEVSHVHLERLRSDEAKELGTLVKSVIERFNIKTPVAHLPADRSATIVEGVGGWRKCLARLLPFIEALSGAGVEVFVIHTLLPKLVPRVGSAELARVGFEETRALLEELDRVAKGIGVRVAVENRVERYAFGSTAEDLLRVCEGLDSVGVCVDVGHANAAGMDPVEFVKACRDRTLVYHLHDNDGSRDQHLPPLLGAVPWDEVVKSLNGSAHRVLEVSCSSREEVCRSYARYLSIVIEVMNLQRAEA